MTTRKAEQLREEEKASGIEVTQTEFDMLLEEILEKENAAKAEIESGDTKKRKAEQDKASADSIRRLAMKRMSQSNTSEGDMGETSSKMKKTRRGPHEMFEFPEKNCERDHQMKQEINLRREEQETMTKMMKQQQKQLHNLQAMFLNQQTQQTKAMLAILEKVELYPNAAALLRCSALFRKININRSAVDISIFFTTEWVTNLHI